LRDTCCTEDTRKDVVTGGSIRGEPGRSFDINLRTGIFCDWASGDKPQSGVINLWMIVRGVDFKTALRELTAFFGDQPDFAQNRPPEPFADKEKENGFFLPSGLGPPVEQDLQVLARTRSIVLEAWRIAAARGLVYCFDDPLNGRCWLFTDSRRRCGLRRRLDGKPFRLSDGSQRKSVCCRGSEMGTPIGYQEAESFPFLGIVEGAPDAIALLANAWASGVETRIAPVCMPSTAANFTDSSLAYVQNKRARIFIHNDAAGRKAANRWATQLASACIEVDGFTFPGLYQTSGLPVKDLNDLLKINYDCWDQFRSQVESIVNFAL
jgi:hypothetical protein